MIGEIIFTESEELSQAITKRGERLIIDVVNSGGHRLGMGDDGARSAPTDRRTRPDSISLLDIFGMFGALTFIHYAS